MSEAGSLIENLRIDCIHYLGDRPCRPHVEAGYRCTCIHFQPTNRRGVPYPVDKAAWHKFASGIDNPYSRHNRQSYVEEIFDITGLPFRREEYWLRSTTETAKAKAAALVPKDSAIGLNIGAGRRWPSRIWPVEYWIELIKLLKARGLQPVLLGGAEEVEMSARLVDATGCLA